MNGWHRRIELLANVAIITAALLLGAALVKRLLLPDSARRGAIEASQVKPGEKLLLPGVDWQKGERTLVMVLSTECHYCSESAPFYQRLAQERVKHAGVSLVAVLPQDTNESTKYLCDHGIAVDEVRQVPLSAVPVKGTPTLIVVDKTGLVVSAWFGKLPAEKEGEVLSLFLGEPRQGA
ncbi:MAG: hypothetical protein M3348_05525 [Acidobacteriota bacterium]|nr:hypothetical protein [Acidobacteriota bacterium]